MNILKRASIKKLFSELEKNSDKKIGFASFKNLAVATGNHEAKQILDRASIKDLVEVKNKLAALSKYSAKGDVLAKWDASDVIDRTLNDIKENPEEDFTEFYINTLKEKYDDFSIENLKNGDYDDDLIEYITSDNTLFDSEWEYTVDSVTNIFREAGKDFAYMWGILGKNMGWRNLSGEKKAKISNWEELRDGVFPKTSDFSFELKEGDKEGSFDLTIWHHDSPTGEFYTLIPAEPISVGTKVRINYNDEEGVIESSFEEDEEMIYRVTFGEGDVEELREEEFEVIESPKTSSKKAALEVSNKNTFSSVEELEEEIKNMQWKAPDHIVVGNIPYMMVYYGGEIVDNYNGNVKGQSREVTFADEDTYLEQLDIDFEDKTVEETEATTDWKRTLGLGASKKAALYENNTPKEVKGSEKGNMFGLEGKDTKIADADITEIYGQKSSEPTTAEQKNIRERNAMENKHPNTSDRKTDIDVVAEALAIKTDFGAILERGQKKEITNEKQSSKKVSEYTGPRYAEDKEELEKVYLDSIQKHYDKTGELVTVMSQGASGIKDGKISIEGFKAEIEPGEQYARSSKKKADNEGLTEGKYDEEQLSMGKEVESEHLNTYDKISDYLEENGELPPREDVYEWIAMDHLDEFDDYYTGLDKMEKELEEKHKSEKGESEEVEENKEEIELVESSKKISTTHDQVIEMFVTNSFPKDKKDVWGVTNLKIVKKNNGWGLYNYLTPLVFRNDSGEVFVDTSKYSMSTTTIQNKIFGSLEKNGISFVETDPVGMDQQIEEDVVESSKKTVSTDNGNINVSITTGSSFQNKDFDVSIHSTAANSQGKNINFSVKKIAEVQTGEQVAIADPVTGETKNITVEDKATSPDNTVSYIGVDETGNKIVIPEGTDVMVSTEVTSSNSDSDGVIMKIRELVGMNHNVRKNKKDS